MLATPRRRAHRVATCSRCDAPVPPSSRVCPSCGADVGPEPASRAGDEDTDPRMTVGVPPPSSSVELVACPQCGAGNAARRRRCGRCGSVLDPDGALVAEPDEDVTTVPSPAPVSPPPPGGTRRRPRRGVVAAIVVVGLLLGTGIGLAFAVGPFRGPDPVAFEPSAHPEEARELEPDSAGATSPESGADTAPARSVDGDRETAWVPAEDDAEPQLVHSFDQPVWVVRVELVAGGADRGSPTRVLLDLGTLRADTTLLRSDEPQAIRLPEPVLLDRARWTVTESVGGPGALAEVRYIGWPSNQRERDAFAAR